MEIQKEIKEKILFGGLLVFIVVNIIFDIYGIVLIKIPLTGNEFYDLVTELYSIQASISTLGIALLALLSESIKEKRYGMRVGHFLMVNHYKLLTHQSIIISSIIILFINYLFLSLNWLNSSVALFVVSLILIIYLTRDILKLFTQKNIVYKEMEDYIISVITKDSKRNKETILNNLNNHLVQLSYEHKILEITENLEVYYIIYRKVNDKELIEKYFEDLYKRISYYGNRDTNEILHISLVEMYEIANLENRHVNFIDQLANQIYEVISSLPQKYYYRDYDFPYITLYKVMRENDDFLIENHRQRGSQSIWYIAEIYHFVFNKINWEDYFGVTRMSAFYNYLFSNFNNTGSIDYDILNIFTKSLIDNKETEVLARSFFDQMKYQSIENNHIKNTHYLSMLVYLYYVLYENVKSAKITELKPYVQSLLNNVPEIVDEYLDELKIENINLQQIILKNKSQIAEWEVFPDSITGASSKTMIADRVVETFFLSLFVSKSCDDNELSNYIKRSGLNINVLYNDVRNYPANFKHCYEVFKNNFMQSSLQDIDEALNITEESLNSLIIDKKLEKAEKLDLKEINEVAEEIMKNVEGTINDKFNNFYDKDLQYNDAIEKELSFSNTIFLDLFEDKKFIEDHVLMRMQLFIIQDFLKQFTNKIKEISVFRRNNNKLERLFDEFNKKINTYDTLIGTYNTFQFYNDPLMEEYENLLNNINVIDIENRNLEKIFLNSKELKIKVKNLKMKFEIFSEREILDQREMVGKRYKFNDSDSNREYLFEKDELLKLFADKYRKVTWKFDVVYEYNPSFTILQYTVVNKKNDK